MKVKRFVAPDMRQAIRWVREEQGPEAVILSTRKTTKGVEIVSAVDFDESVVQRLVDGARSVSGNSEPRPPAQAERGETGPGESKGQTGAPPRRAPQRPNVDRATRNSRAGSDGARTSQPPPTGKREAAVKNGAVTERRRDDSSANAEKAIATLRSELRSMRGLLNSRLTALADNDYERREPTRSRIGRRLETFGLTSSTARSVADQVRDTGTMRDSWREALKYLAGKIPVAERDPLERGGRIALVGPAGVGKTVVARKMAEAFARDHGRQSIALISTNTAGLDGPRELIALGQALGIYTLTAGGAAELRDALDAVVDRRLVLIDTAGISHRDPRVQNLSRILSHVPGVQPWLVLSASAQRRVLEGTIRSFAGLRPRGCVLTKVDECAVMGEPVDALIRSGLPVAHLSAGQNRSSGLQRARGGGIVQLMLDRDGENRKQRADAGGQKDRQARPEVEAR